MTTRSSTPLLLRDALLRHCFIFTWLLGILTYGYHYAGANMAFDALIGANLYDDIIPKIYMGRYGQVLNYYCVRGFAAAPWMIGILTMLWLTLTNFLIVKLFGVKRKWEILLICGITMTSIPFIQTHALYFHEIDNFALALLTGVLSIYLYIIKPFRASIIAAGLSFILSISFYQPYIMAVPSIFIILLVRDIFAGASMRMTVIKFFRFCLFVMISCCLYYAFHQSFLYFANIRDIDSYNNVNTLVGSAGGDSFIKSVIGEFFYTYFYGLVHFLRPITYFSNVVGLLHGVLVVIAIYQVARLMIITRMRFLSILVIVALLVLLLPCIYFIRILTDGFSHPGILNIEIFVILSLLLLIISAREQCPALLSASGAKLQRCVYYATILICLFSFYSNWVYANRLFYLRELIGKTSLSFCTRLIERIEKRDDYVPRETPVVFIGTAGDSPYLVSVRPAFADFQKTLFLSGPTLVEYETFFNYRRYFNNFFGTTMYIKQTIMSAHEALPAGCEGMSIFPQEDSIRKINNTLYVKLSNFALPPGK